MKALKSVQAEDLEDSVRAKFAMVVPVLEATLASLNRRRVDRLGGLDKVTLSDLAREYRAGSGDAGICFEYAVNEAIAAANPLIHPLASEVLENYCGIQGGSHSLLFGPEKEGVIPILESVQDALTDDSRVYVSNRGQPPKLRRYIPQIMRAFHRNEVRNSLPRSISGLWKADLFIGNKNSEKWVGTTVKVNPRNLQGAQGLRIGIYPRADAPGCPSARRGPQLDPPSVAVRRGVHGDLLQGPFYLTRAFLRADAEVPPPVDLPDAEDRFVTAELEARRDFPIRDVMGVLRDMSQEGLLQTADVEEIPATAALSEEGLEDESATSEAEAGEGDLVSLTPEPQE